MPRYKYTTTGDGRRVKAQQTPWAVQQRMLRHAEARRLAWTVAHNDDTEIDATSWGESPEWESYT